MGKIAFIGTGSMGRPMIEKLLRSAYEVQVHDRNRTAADPVLSLGAVWRDTPRDAALGCDTVVTCLPLPQHVLENMLGADGALAGMSEATTWIDSSTTDYHNTLHIAARAAEKGVYSLEAPVSNLSHMGVDFANASVFVGGDRRAYDQNVEALNTMAQKAFYIGEIGQAQSVKLLTNLLFYTATVAMGEILCLAAEAGIPLHRAWEHMIASDANSVAFEQFAPFLFDGSYDHSCTLEIAVKDMSLTVALADELGVSLPVGRAVERRYRSAGERFDGQDNHIKVIRLTEELNGLELRFVNYVAPSKYGASPDYPSPREFITDDIGRTKPRLVHRFEPTNSRGSSQAHDALLDSLQDFGAYVNHAVLMEAHALGAAMGLNEALISEVITWSVGASAVSDHPRRFQADRATLQRMSRLHTRLKLPALRDLLGALTEEEGFHARQ